MELNILNISSNKLFFLSPVKLTFCSCYLFEITHSIMLSAFHCCSRYRLGKMMRRCCVNPIGLVLFPPFLCYLTRPDQNAFQFPALRVFLAMLPPTPPYAYPLPMQPPLLPRRFACHPFFTTVLYLCPLPFTFLWVIPDATPYCLPPSAMWFHPPSPSDSYNPATTGNPLLQPFFAKLSIPLFFSPKQS